MRLRSSSASAASGGWSRWIALGSVALAVPLLVAQPGAATLLLAASVLGAAVFLERRPSSVSVSRRLHGGLAALAPVRPRTPQACARWELVERDGRRALEMRWR